MGKNDARQLYHDLVNPTYLYNRTVNMYRNKYYNLYRANFKWTGLNYRQEAFLMAKLYNDGTIAAFNMGAKDFGEIGFAKWTKSKRDMYGCPEVVNLTAENDFNLIPQGEQIVDRDVVLGWLQPNGKGLQETVFYYVDKIAECEMVINTNLQLQKMPFLIPVETEDANKIKDIVRRIINNEISIFAEGFDPALFKAVSTGSQYIIDKLVNYKRDLENELKTILGVNNPGQQKIEQLQLAEVNANNQEIMDYESCYIKSLTEFCDRVRDILGVNISVVSTSGGLKVDGIVKTYEDKTGPKEEQEEVVGE